MPLTLNSSGIVVVDDSDARITYQGSWERAGVPEELNSTTHGSQVAGSTATFLFNGTTVAVYGTVGVGGNPSSTYAIDDSSMVVFNPPGVQVVVHQTLFYQSPPLQDGQHRLVITSLSREANSMYWLDYLLYQPSPVDNSSTTTPLLYTTSTSLPSTTSTGGPPSSTDGASTGALTGQSIGAIVGGTLGGILLLAGIAALFYYKRRRPRPIKHREDLLGLDNPQTSAWVDPYPSESNSLVTHSARHPPPKTLPMYGTPAVDSTYHSQASGSSEHSRMVRQPDPGYSSEVTTDRRSRTTKQRPPTAGSSSQVRLHQDGGIRIAEGPRYTQHSSKRMPTDVTTSGSASSQELSSQGGYNRFENGDQQASGDTSENGGESSQEQLLPPQTIVDLPPAYEQY